MRKMRRVKGEEYEEDEKGLGRGGDGYEEDEKG